MTNVRGDLVACWALAGFAGIAIVGEASAQAAASPRAVIDRYCVGCHNDKAKAGGLVLNTLNPDNPTEKPEVWEKVVRKLRVRYMPPAGMPQPDARTYDSLISHFET